MTTDACPFCGDPDPHVDECDEGVFSVICQTCMAAGPVGYTQDEALAKWRLRDAALHLQEEPTCSPA